MQLLTRTIQDLHQYPKAAEFRIFNVFENTQKTGCTNPGCVVAVANNLPKTGA
jgi:hypothetical protein